MAVTWHVVTWQVSTLELEARAATDRNARLEVELTTAQGARDRFEEDWRAASARERALEARLSACAAEREHAATRLQALPEALKTLQVRYTRAPPTRRVAPFRPNPHTPARPNGQRCDTWPW